MPETYHLLLVPTIAYRHPIDLKLGTHIYILLNYRNTSARGDCARDAAAAGVECVKFSAASHHHAARPAHAHTPQTTLTMRENIKFYTCMLLSASRCRSKSRPGSLLGWRRRRGTLDRYPSAPAGAARGRRAVTLATLRDGRRVMFSPVWTFSGGGRYMCVCLCAWGVCVLRVCVCVCVRARARATALHVQHST